MPSADKNNNSNDLIAENWQAPKREDLKGSGREVWEYGGESAGPSLRLAITTIIIVLVLVGVLSGICWMIYNLFNSPV